LLEILVALSIMVIIVGISFATYVAATESVSRCNARMAVEQEARTVLRRMAREIRSSCIPPSASASAAKTAEETESFEEKPASAFKAEKESRDEVLLRLVTAGGTPRPDEIIPGLSVVAYRLDESTGTLYRLQARIVDPPEVFDDEDNWLVCARDVKAVEFEYFDGEEWQEDWDSYSKGMLPLAARIKITLQSKDCPPVSFVTSAGTPCHGRRFTEIEVRGVSRERSVRIGDDNVGRPKRIQK